jgi:hypothetical protein
MVLYIISFIRYLLQCPDIQWCAPDPAESRWARFVDGAPSFANLSNGVSEAIPHGFAGWSSAPSGCSRRNNDLPLHERMKAAEIIESSRLVEGEGKFVLGVERRRTELTVRCDYVMRDVVVVLPNDSGSDRDGDRVPLE